MKIKLFKSLLVTASVLSLVFTPAFAKTEMYTTYGDSGNIILNIKSDEGDCQYAVIVTKPSNTIENMEEAAPWKTIPADFAGTKGTATLKSFDLGTPSDVGSYTLYASGGNMTENIVLSFAFGALENEVTSALSAINEANSALEVESALKASNGSVWSVDANKLSSVSSAFAGLKKEIYSDSFASVNDVEECFRKALIIKEFIQAKQGELAKLYSWYEDELNLSLDGETVELVKASDNAVEKAFNDLKKDEINSINTLKDLETLLETSVALGKLNTATRENTEEIWDKYGVLLGIKEADGDYVNSDFEDVNTYDLIKLVVRSEGRSPFTSLKDVKTAYDKAIKSLLEDDNKKGSSGGGGGGGGGMSIGSSVAVTDSEILKDSVAEVPTSRMFKDLPLTHWALREIEYAATVGIVNGDNLGNANPDAQITRAEFAQLITSSFDLLRAATGSPKLDFLEHNDTKEAPKGKEFSDVPYESWFYNAVDTAYKAGVVSGYDDGCFGATDYITRQDAAAMLLRAKDASSLVITTQKDEIKFTDSDEISAYASDAVNKLQKYGVINGYTDGSFRPKAFITRAEAIKLIYEIRRLSGNL